MTIWIALIMSVPPTIAAVSALIVAVRSHDKIVEVAHSVNGLLAARVNAAKAEGRMDEQHDQAEAKNG